MKHITEDDLILHYYGETSGADDRAIATHLASCSACHTELTRLQRVLGAVDEAAVRAEIPDGFERTVWARLEPNLAQRDRGWFGSWLFSPATLALTAAVAILVAASFFAGRVSAPATNGRMANAEQVRERILLVDLGEHLDRSQMVLVELVSADGDGVVDISGERARAEELVAANRLYRQAAVQGGDTAVAAFLDELERVLVDVAASPETVPASQLDDVRRRIDSGGLLFKVRVVSSKVRERQKQSRVDNSAGL
jgi:anti-sigma factor RsiW